MPNDEDRGWHYREAIEQSSCNQPSHPLKLRRTRGNGKPDSVTGKNINIWRRRGGDRRVNTSSKGDYCELLVLTNEVIEESEARQQAARTMGRKGGLSKIPIKVAKSRENGKKGGRPRKVSEE